MNFSQYSTASAQTLVFKSQKIGELPVSGSEEKYRGTAGAFSGIVNNKLIIAGGSNFPDKKPWEGGNKLYLDKIYLFNIYGSVLSPLKNEVKLNEPMAYGSSVSLPAGVLCIGGNGPVSCSSKVFLIRWSETAKKIVIKNYPELPVPLSYSTAAILDNFVYLSGGSTSPDGKETKNYFFRLDLSAIQKSGSQWEKLPVYPGMSRILSISAVQSNGTRKCLYLFSGRNNADPTHPIVFKDGLMFDPVLRHWDEVKSNLLSSFQVMAGSVFSWGDDKLVFVGGAPDSTFLKEQNLKNELAKSIAQDNDTERDTKQKELLLFYNSHKGFSSNILVYNTITRTLTKAGDFSSLCPVTTKAIPYGNGAIIPCGEIKPGTRTPDIFRVFKE